MTEVFTQTISYRQHKASAKISVLAVNGFFFILNLLLLHVVPADSGENPYHQKGNFKSTIPLLAETGPKLTACFYDRMFTHDPELKDIFNLSNPRNKPIVLAQIITTVG